MSEMNRPAMKFKYHDGQFFDPADDHLSPGDIVEMLDHYFVIQSELAALKEQNEILNKRLFDANVGYLDLVELVNYHSSSTYEKIFKGNESRLKLIIERAIVTMVVGQELTAEKEKCARLMEALEFYADTTSWSEHGLTYSPEAYDVVIHGSDNEQVKGLTTAGKRARQALEQDKKEEG